MRVICETIRDVTLLSLHLKLYIGESRIVNPTAIRGEGVIFTIKRPLNEKMLNKREKRQRFGCNQHHLFKSKGKEEE